MFTVGIKLILSLYCIHMIQYRAKAIVYYLLVVTVVCVIEHPTFPGMLGLF